MKQIHEETNLVVAGAWNPAILTPPWVLKHGLHKELDGSNRYQAFLPAGFGMVFEAPRYVLDDLTFSVRPDSLLIVPKVGDGESYAQAEVVAARMLGLLAHTPIFGVGHNFEFRHADPTGEQLEVFTRSRSDVAQALPEGWLPGTAGIVSSFSKQAGKVVINVNRAYEADTLIVKINFHHPVSNAEEAIRLLSEGSELPHMTANAAMAREFLTTLYGEISDE